MPRSVARRCGHDHRTPRMGRLDHGGVVLVLPSTPSDSARSSCLDRKIKKIDQEVERLQRHGMRAP